MKAYITDQIGELHDLIGVMLEDENLLSGLEVAATECINCLQGGGKILLAGNGGSAAEAQHIAAEFIGRFAFDRESLPAIALTTNTSNLTAISNDYGFENLFARQLQSLGKKSDVFIAYSTSGSSPNILRALKEARKIGLASIGLTGDQGSPMRELCDHLLMIPSSSTPRIQEGHVILGHILCGLVERVLFDRASS